MATYAQRPDGLFEVTLDDGRVMPTALEPSLLEAQGFQPMMQPPAPMPDERLALGENMSTAPMSRLDAPPAPMGPPAPPPAAAPTPDYFAPEPPPPPPSPMAQQYEQMAAGYDKKPLVQVQMPGGAQQQAKPVDQIAERTKQFMAGELAPRGGPAKRIKAHDERAAYNIKYRDTSTDPALEAAIGEGRDNVLASREELAERNQGDLATQARISANEARDAQRQIEQTVTRKNAIDQEVGKRLQAIDARFAKARAVTESGSARERVMKSKGSFGRILAVIGMALGEFGRANGGRNPVQDQINLEVQEEMEREKALYDASPETSALKAYVDAWGTPQQAIKELELNKREAVQAQMEAWVRRAGADSVPIEFANWVADQNLANLEAKRKLQEDAAAEVTEQWRHVPEKVVGGYSRPDPLKVAERGARFYEAMQKATGGKKADPKEEERLRQLYVPGEGFAYSETEAAKLRTAKQSKEELSALADEAMDIRQQYRDRKINLYTAKQRLASNKGQAMTAYKGVKQMGTLDQQTERVFNDIYGSVDSLPSIVLERAGVQLGTERTQSLKDNIERDWQRARTNQITTDPYGTTPARPSTPKTFKGRE